MSKQSRLLVLVLLVSICFVTTAHIVLAQNNQKYMNVKIGVAPYAMFMIWNAAHELEIDKEFGLQFQLITFTNMRSTIQAMIRGDVDIAACALADLVVLKNAPRVRLYTVVGHFKGFIFVGRKDRVQPYAELAKKYGPERAKEYQLKNMKGKTIAINPTEIPLVLDAINQVGMTEKDIRFLIFDDAQKAAIALINGSADFYIGSLPQQRRLLSMPDFINAGGSELLGPMGLWYDQMVSDERFMVDNREKAIRTLAVMYRTIRLFDENPDLVANVGAKILSELTGGDFPPEEYKTMQTEFDNFISVIEAKEQVYNSNDSMFIERPVKIFMKGNTPEEDLTKTMKPEDYYGPATDLFAELLTRNDLMDIINSPFSL